MVDHHKIKDRILSEISKTFFESVKENNSYYGDSISRLDWSSADDWDRKWVNILIPNFHLSIQDFLRECGYREIELREMWYQQYQEGDTHGWHIHGQHFTGVYYLEFPEGCSKTEICSPYDLKSRTIDVVEGDFIVFPAHYIHRGLPNTKKRKTIVSYNFDAIGNDGLNLNLIKENNPNTWHPSGVN